MADAEPAAPTPPTPAHTPPPPARRRRWPWWLLAVLCCALAAIVGAAAWLLGTQSGLDTALRLAMDASAGAVRIDGARGRLIDTVHIDALHYRDEALQVNVDELELRWQPRQLWSRRVLVEHVRAARVEVIQHPGTTSTDEPPPSPPTTLEIPFGVEVERLQVDEFVLHSVPATESAAEGSKESADGSAPLPLIVVRDFSASLRSDGRHHQVQGLTLALPQGRVDLDGEIDGRSPFALDLRTRFAGELERRALQAQATIANTLLEPLLNASAEAEGVSAQAEAELAPFASAPLRTLKLHGGEINPAAFVAGAPQAALVIDAELTAPRDGDALLAGPLRIENRRPATIDQGGVPVHSVSGKVRLSSVHIAVDALEVVLPGAGRIVGSLNWRPPATAAALNAMPDTMPGATSDANTETAANAAARADEAAAAAASAFGELVAALELAGIDPRTLDTRLPAQIVAGKLDASADANQQQAEIALSAGAARIDARARLLAAAGEAARRFSVDGRLRDVDPSAFIADAPPARMNVDIDASGDLPAEGLPQAAQLDFRIADSRFRGQPLSGEGKLRVAGERLPEVAVLLQLGRNRVDARGAWGAPGDALALKLDAPALDALDPAFGGRAQAEGKLRGTLAMPAGELKFSASALRLPGEVRVLGADGDIRLDNGVDGPFRLALNVRGVGPSGSDADGIALPDWIARGRVNAEGRRDAHDIALEVDTPAQDGVADSVRAQLRGGLRTEGKTGAPSWQGELSALTTVGRFASALQAPAPLHLAADSVRLGSATLYAGERGRIRVQETSWSPAAIVARGSISGFVVEPAPPPDRRARSRRSEPLTLGAEWDLSAGKVLAGEARIFRESGDLAVEGEIRTRLGLQRLQAVLNANGDRLALAFEAAGSEFGQLGGSAALRAQRSTSGVWSIAADAPLQGSAVLDMPSITWLGRLAQENIETGGRIKGAFTLSGTVSAPLASGRIEGRALQIALVDEGLQLSGGEFDVEFDRDRVRLERLHFVSPNRVQLRDSRIPFARLTATPGSLTARGALALDSGAGEFTFAAERLPLLQRDDRWMILSGEGSAHTSWTTLKLDADFRADAGYLEFADSPPPSLSDDVVVLGRNDDRPPGAFGVSADVRVNLGKALYLSAMGLDTRLEGELRVRMRPGAPMSAVGSVSTVGGSYRGYGQNLVIDRGVVNFQGPLDAPGLNIVALRKGLAVEAGVSVTGSAKRPQVRLISEPNVPDPEKLSWIVLGRAPDAASGADLGLLLPAAQALLGGPGGGMTDELSRSLGFDSFSIGQGELNSTSRAATSRVVGSGSTIASDPSVSGQVLSLGKRLSSDLMLSFEQSLGDAGTLVKLTYQLSRRLSLIARGGTDNSVDLNYSFSFR